jgi:hypothetical protein
MTNTQAYFASLLVTKKSLIIDNQTLFNDRQSLFFFQKVKLFTFLMRNKMNRIFE